MDGEWEDAAPGDEMEDDQLRPIPAHLYSVYEDGPFSVCSICTEPLAAEEGNRLYELKKVYRGRNVIFECAICHECGHRLLSEYSRESIENIKNFFEEKFTPGLSIFECHFCGAPRDLDASAVSIMAVCIGPNLVQQPVCMCDPCTEEINERLSQKTQEINGEFLSTYFPGIPAEWQDSPIIHL
jgi:hypothetical protein